MSFSRQVKKAGQVERLEQHVAALETFEVRAMMMLGTYEAIAGPVPADLMKAVQEGIQGKEYKNKAEFFEAVVGVAKSILAEEEFRRAEAELAARTESQGAPGTQDTLNAAVAGLQLSLSDTSGTPEGGQAEG